MSCYDNLWMFQIKEKLDNVLTDKKEDVNQTLMYFVPLGLGHLELEFQPFQLLARIVLVMGQVVWNIVQIGV